ncbi:MAG: PfaD family polyunsaturated fatty acid/polyketide biosynthesis protein [Candidatus Eremiobacterota bacterium]
MVVSATTRVGAGPCWWVPGPEPPVTGEAALQDQLLRLGEPCALVERDGQLAVALGGQIALGGTPATPWLPLRGHVTALHPSQLGDPGFCQAHGVRYAYVAGAMANGIASEELVEAMAREGLLAIFGAAGLAPDRVEAAIHRLQGSLGDRPFGFNLIHSPNETGLEDALVDLYLRHGVRRVCASAFLALTLPLLRYRLHGIHRDPNGHVVTPNQVLGKVSRAEVARKFLSPAPEAMLRKLVEQGHLTDEQARLAEEVPVAEDLTAEADSGGHTDNRPLVTLLPSMVTLRDELQERYRYARPIRIGAAGGVATPASAAGAFAMGASYVLTGSINQGCVEAGTSATVKEMLAQASQSDINMAPAADMFEMGVRVQVLKWGTMFAVKARKLYELYRANESLETLPAAERATLERDYFRRSVEEEWHSTRRFFEQRDPRQVARADQDPKHRMALVFRSYLGQSSRWANAGEPSRKVDYQIWCGPAMGAFNEWARGTFLEQLSERRVAVLAHNLMFGAAYLTRLHWLQSQGVHLPAAVRAFRPMKVEDLLQRLS